MTLAAYYDVFSSAQPSAPMVARGDSLFDDNGVTQLSSPLFGIDDAAWTKFVNIMATAQPGNVSPSNMLGMFEFSPRRLADLGAVNKLVRIKSPSGRTIWAGKFVAPMTCNKFLRNPQVQYRYFCGSMKEYTSRIMSGEIDKSDAMSLSGALSLLHRAGPQALRDNKRFSATQAIYEKARDIF